jgi:hypothetical protein
MGGASSRRKGHSWERSVAIRLRSVFPKARRQLEYHEDDCNGVDIANTGRFKFQCKKLKKYSPITAIEEIKCDVALGDIPVLVTAGDRQPPMAILPFDNLMELLHMVVKKK